MDNFTSGGATPFSAGGSSRDGARGQAALLLVESLMHALVSKGVLSKEDFIDIVEGAAEVENDLMIINATSPSDFAGSLLSPLAEAFRRELGK